MATGKDKKKKTAKRRVKAATPKPARETRVAPAPDPEPVEQPGHDSIPEFDEDDAA